MDGSTQQVAPGQDGLPHHAAAPKPPIAVIELDRFCEGCGYNLRTQAVVRDERTGIPIVRCPECGRHQSANDTATALRPWMHRLTGLAIGGYVLLMIGALFWLAAAQTAIGYASLEEMTSRERIEMPMPDGTTRYGRGARVVWTDMPYREAFIAAVLAASGSVAFLNGVLIVVLMPHWRRRHCAYFLIALPSLIWLVGVLIWRDGVPHLLTWGMTYLTAFAAVQLLGGMTAVALGRPFARMLVRIFIPPSLRPRLAYLWMVDRLEPPSSTSSARLGEASPPAR